MGSLLVVGIIILGFAMMVGGRKAAKKVLTAPLKVLSGLVIDLATGVLKLTFSLLDKGLRAAGRLLDRGIRRLFRLPPPRPRQPPQLPQQQP
jgi:hypothetical protein